MRCGAQFYPLRLRRDANRPQSEVAFRRRPFGGERSRDIHEGRLRCAVAVGIGNATEPGDQGGVDDGARDLTRQQMAADAPADQNVPGRLTSMMRCRSVNF